MDALGCEESAPDQIMSVPDEIVRRYVDAGYWRADTLADRIAALAAAHPRDAAFIEPSERLDWRSYEQRSSELAGVLMASGLRRGDRVAVWLPDGPAVHVAFVAAEKAGVTVLGLGPRAGDREVCHLLDVTGARAIVTHAEHRDRRMAPVVADLVAQAPALAHHVIVPGPGPGPAPAGEVLLDGAPAAVPSAGELARAIAARRMGPNDLWLLNSTSGTTGLPKCVTQFQNRWFYFHQLAVDAGELRPSDVFMSAVPAPFGFGLWTAHFTPTLLGAPVVVMARFTPEEALRLVEQERVTVLACVSTQFIMMLNSPSLGDHDLSSLRVMFTGGEAVPYERAVQFEERTGAAVLQFYGSNETGALSRTTTRDPREVRLRTAGRVISQMQVRLYDDGGRDITATGRGEAACRGPATSIGYFNDDAATAELLTSDGWMLTGDIATIDAHGCLRVVGRKSDIIIRGGKNISAAAVEHEVATHPAVALAAAVAMPDDTFGERVCVYAVLRPGWSLTLAALCEHLDGRGVSREWFPEHLEVVDRLEEASGGKVAKAKLREDIRRRLGSKESGGGFVC